MKYYKVLSAFTVPFLLVALTQSACTSVTPDNAAAIRVSEDGLVRDVPYHSEALDEDVVLHKTVAEQVAIRTDGSREPMSAFRARERAAHLAKFGKFDADDGRRVARAADDEVLFVGGTFHADLSEIRARSFVRRHVHWRETLAEHQATDVTLSSDYPVVTFRIRAVDLRRVWRDDLFDGLTLVDGVVTGNALPEAVTDAPQAFSGIDPAGYALGVTGETQKIGLVDVAARVSTGRQCRVLETHGVWNTPVTYLRPEPAQSCSANSDCIAACGEGNCVGGKCVDGHGHTTASIIPQIAPKASIYYTSIDIYSGRPEADLIAQHADNFARFKKAEVKIINESYRSPEYRSKWFGVFEDRAARFDDTFITVSAGNNGGVEEGDEPACPFILNALCVGSHTRNLRQSCFSDYRNPGFRDYFPAAKDREEPDILAFGGQRRPVNMKATACASGETSVPLEQVRVASPSSSTAYVGSEGTSYAAPNAAAHASLLQEYCTSQKRPLSALELRALLMAGADRNAERSRYSTLLLSSVDEKQGDGAGILSIVTAMNACNPRPPSGDFPNLTIVSDTVNTKSGDPMPQAKEEKPRFEVPPEVHINNQARAPGSADGRLGKSYFSYPGLVAGSRIRAVLSWNGCAGNTAPNTIGTDFDLFLYNKSKQQYYFASQSNDDNNEGFDVDVLPGYEGDYEVIVAWPNGAPGCPGEGGNEPFTVIAGARK